MRAILVEPEHRTISAIETDGRLESLQKLVDGYIEGVYPAYAHPDFEGVHCYVDEEGLYRKSHLHAWSLPGYPHLRGPGVFLCSTPDGEEAPCTMSVLALARHVEWSA